MLKKVLATGIMLGLATSAAHAQGTVVFDDITNYQKGAAGAAVASTGSTPNTFMGDGYTLSSRTKDITGFDLYPVNVSGTSFTGLKINIYVWGAVNAGAVSATAPAFSNLLGSYSLTSTGAFTTGFFFNFESATPGVTPGITLTTPLAISSPTIGLTVNYQGTTDGITYSSVNSLTSLITYGTAPTAGSEVFSGYYRNAASETNGNFTSTLRTLGNTNEGLALRVYGDLAPAATPEPSQYAAFGLGILGVGALALKARRRSSVSA